MKIKYIAGIGILCAVLVMSGFFLWQKKIQPHIAAQKAEEILAAETMLKIGFVPDWEYDTRKKLQHKLPLQSTAELTKAVDYLNNEYHPDWVIGGGDYIESSDRKPERAKELLTEINAIFSRVHAPRAYVLGNHDMRSLSKEEVRSILGMEENHRIIDTGAWRMVLLDTNFNKDDDSDRNAKQYVLGYVSRAEMEWLDRALDTDKPTIMFSHHSPVEGHSGDFILGSNIVNQMEVRAMLEKHPNVALVVSGHSPASRYVEANGVHYFIVDTLVHDIALGSFATLNLSYNPILKRARITVVQLGAKPHAYSAEKFFP